MTKEQIASKNFNYIQLQQSTSKLDEIQIQAYGKTSRRLSTGNILSIQESEIKNQMVDNPLLILQGRVPNLYVQNTSGLPGSKITLQLRGQNSLGSQSHLSEPLIVIDGVPFANNIKAPEGILFNNQQQYISALSFLNPNDIESINVLSDADATSIYGSRGGNGVILISTKKAKVGEMRINGDINSGFSQAPRERKIKLLNTEQYLEMRREAYLNDGIDVPNENTPLFEKNSSNYDLTIWDQTKYTDWQEQLLGGEANWTTARISISGGNAVSGYLISGNYRNQGYVYPSKQILTNKPSNEMGNLHFNFNGNSVNGKLKASLNGGYSVSSNKGSAQDLTYWAMTLSPNAPSIFNTNGELNWEPNKESASLLGTWTNPYADLLKTNEIRNTNLSANFDISYNPFQAVIFKVQSGFTELSTDNLNLYPIASRDPSTYATATGRAFHGSIRNKTYTLDPQLSYTIGAGKSNFNFLAGLTIQRQTSSSESIIANGYTDDSMLRNLSSARSISSTNSTSDYRYFGLFARMNYDIDKRYLLNINLRRDGSSRFGPGRQYGNFWSIGSGYIFSDISSFKKFLPVVSFGKIRASYGKSGNDGIADYGFLELYETITDGTYQGIKTIRSKGAINPDYGWEDVYKGELAIDAGFFNDRVVISTAYWRTRSSNQLSKLPLPTTAGGGEGERSNLSFNQAAKIQNSGWEFLLNSKNITTKNFTWQTSANLGIQHNKILKIPEGFISFPDIVRGYKARGEDPVGQPFSGSIFTYQARGVNPETGTYSFSDKDGNIAVDPFLSDAFMYSKKINLNPKILGVANLFSYNSFQMSINIQAVKQLGANPMFNYSFGPPGSFGAYRGYGNQPSTVLDSWRPELPNTNIQKYTQGFGDAYFGWIGMTTSDEFYVDASYLRINNVSLTYNVSSSITKRMNLKSLTVTASAQNLFTLTNYKGGDPVTQNVTVLPTLKTFTFGISLGL